MRQFARFLPFLKKSLKPVKYFPGESVILFRTFVNPRSDKTMNLILKSILAGLLLGAALFMLPFFLLRLAVFFLLMGAFFRLVRGPRRGPWAFGKPGRGFGQRGFAFADRIRQMSDEEYNAFKQQRCGHWGRQAPYTQSAETTNL